MLTRRSLFWAGRSLKLNAPVAIPLPVNAKEETLMNNLNFAINSDFVAFRQGEYVSYSVNEKAGEFILNDRSDFPKATLLEIAEANGLSVSSSLKKADMLSEILNQLSEKDIPEMSEKPQSEIVKDIVAAGTEEGKDDDAILIEIVEAGIKFSAAMKLFREAQTSLGLRMTAKNRREYVAEVLGDDFAPTTPDEMNEAILKIAEHDAITEAQARGAVRKYLRDHEREVPKAVKAAASGGARAKVFDFIASNPSASTEDLAAAVADIQSDPEKAERMVKRFTPTLLLANRIAENLS